MPDNAVLLQELYTSWAFQASNDGSYELAAKCWLAAGELSQAASLLAKRPDPSSLRVASFLAGKWGKDDKARILATQCASQCIKFKNWKCMETLMSEVNLPIINQMWEESRQQRDELLCQEQSGSNQGTSDQQTEDLVQSPDRSASNPTSGFASPTPALAANHSSPLSLQCNLNAEDKFPELGNSPLTDAQVPDSKKKIRTIEDETKQPDTETEVHPSQSKSRAGTNLAEIVIEERGGPK